MLAKVIDIVRRTCKDAAKLANRPLKVGYRPSRHSDKCRACCELHIKMITWHVEVIILGMRFESAKTCKAFYALLISCSRHGAAYLTLV